LGLGDGRSEDLQGRRPPLGVETRDHRLIEDRLVPRAQQTRGEGIVVGATQARNEAPVIEQVVGGQAAREQDRSLDEHPLEQLALVVEMRVKGPNPDRRSSADLVDARGAVPVLSEGRLGPVHQPFERLVRPVRRSHVVLPEGPEHELLEETRERVEVRQGAAVMDRELAGERRHRPRDHGRVVPGAVGRRPLPGRADGRSEVDQERRTLVRMESCEVRFIEDGLVPRPQQPRDDGFVGGRAAQGPPDEHSLEQVAFVVEMRVKGPDSHIRAGADLVDIRRVVATLGECGLRAVEEAVEAVRIVPAARCLPPFGIPV
jgi:hypothetical protein